MPYFSDVTKRRISGEAFGRFVVVEMCTLYTLEFFIFNRCPIWFRLDTLNSSASVPYLIRIWHFYIGFIVEPSKSIRKPSKETVINVVQYIYVKVSTFFGVYCALRVRRECEHKLPTVNWRRKQQIFLPRNSVFVNERERERARRREKWKSSLFFRVLWRKWATAKQYERITKNNIRN